MKVFLDVGAHMGETVRAVVGPRYGFDRIVCFEPTRACQKRLERFRDPRITVCDFGLWNQTCERPIFQPGNVGATIMADERNRTDVELISLRRASDWFRENLSENDEVFMKLNVEAAECDIIDDLLDTDELRRVRSMYVAFDVRKFPSLRHREGEVKERLERAGFGRFWEARDVAREPTHVARMQRWLDEAGARAQAGDMGSRARVRLRRFCYVDAPLILRSLQIHRAARALVPTRIYWRLRARVKGDGFIPARRRRADREGELGRRA